MPDQAERAISATSSAFNDVSNGIRYRWHMPKACAANRKSVGAVRPQGRATLSGSQRTTSSSITTSTASQLRRRRRVVPERYFFSRSVSKRRGRPP